MFTANDSIKRSQDLLGIFHADTDSFALIKSAEATRVPEPFHALLNHNSHMTVAMERHHSGPVSLQVVQVREEAGSEFAYAREILLAKGDQTIVQYGVVRLNLSVVEPSLADAIRNKKTPLGRLLIEANVLREVRNVQLIEVVPEEGLRKLLGGSEGRSRTFGRVAHILLDNQPAIELLEVVSPE